MISDTAPNRHLSKDKLEKRLDDLGIQMGAVQRQAADKRIPMIIVFEGWDICGSAEHLNSFIHTIDPRGYKLVSGIKASKNNRGRPFIWPYFIQMPGKGRIAIFDQSWYSDLILRYVKGEKKSRFESHLKDIRMLEMQHASSDYMILKFFLNLSKKDLKKKVEKNGRHSIFDEDIQEETEEFLDDYNELSPLWDKVISKTNWEHAPWVVIDDADDDYVNMRILESVISATKKKLAYHAQNNGKSRNSKKMALRTRPVLDKVDLSKKMSLEDYKDSLDEAKERMSDLQIELKREDIPTIIAFEGWDAAGKGGIILRLTRALNPRGYQVAPVGPPNDFERIHQWMWRFYRFFPQRGLMTIFDRSWYGRVLVERVEGFATSEEWHRAYDEINDMERMLADDGAIIIKFWLHIDKQTQLGRFKQREVDPRKKWKITEEDWRNREKWDDYVVAVNDMLSLTNTKHAPWVVIPSDDKWFARVKTIKTVMDIIEKRLD